MRPVCLRRRNQEAARTRKFILISHCGEPNLDLPSDRLIRVVRSCGLYERSQWRNYAIHALAQPHSTDIYKISARPRLGYVPTFPHHTRTTPNLLCLAVTPNLLHSFVAGTNVFLSSSLYRPTRATFIKVRRRAHTTLFHPKTSQPPVSKNTPSLNMPVHFETSTRFHPETSSHAHPSGSRRRSESIRNRTPTPAPLDRRSSSSSTSSTSSSGSRADHPSLKMTPLKRR